MGDTAVIDAATFANSYNAFWHAYTPTCEHFVRRLNSGGLKRFGRPMPKSDTARRRALIAEYAFSLCVERNKDVAAVDDARSEGVVEEMAWQATEVRLRPFANEGLELDRKFTIEERHEIDEIAERLLRFFGDGVQQPVFRPVFFGCGFIDASEGDAVFGRTIYEVKTVERPFRSSDIRQTLTYAALNYASKQFDVKNVGLFNPRRGQFREMSLNDVCAEISGRPAQELLTLVVEAVSSGEISR
jgi:hypothetical protein